MITKITSIQELKQIFLEIFLNKTDKVNDVSAESVLNGLQYVKQNFHENSQKIFALIHDAARPLLKQQTLQKFIQQILLFYQQNPSQNVGGLLAMPLADTLKSEKNQQVIKTIPREHLFLAQTPQMFLFDVLFSALQNCSDCTDESSAVEKLNYHIIFVYVYSINLNYYKSVLKNILNHLLNIIHRNLLLYSHQNLLLLIVNLNLQFLL